MVKLKLEAGNIHRGSFYFVHQVFQTWLEENQSSRVPHEQREAQWLPNQPAAATDDSWSKCSFVFYFPCVWIWLWKYFPTSWHFHAGYKWLWQFLKSKPWVALICSSFDWLLSPKMMHRSRLLAGVKNIHQNSTKKDVADENTWRIYK